MDLDDFIIAVFCVVDEAAPRIMGGQGLRQHGPQPVLADSEVITMEVVGAYLGLEQESRLFAYFRQHYAHFFPALRTLHRTTATGVAVWEEAERWLDPTVERVDAILDHLSAPRAPAVLRFALAHARWECVFQPTYAAYLNLSEPWGQVLRSLALTGKRFATWEENCAAVAAATSDWNGHRHPCVWGRRRRHRPRRQPGIAAVPLVA